MGSGSPIEALTMRVLVLLLLVLSLNALSACAAAPVAVVAARPAPPDEQARALALTALDVAEQHACERLVDHTIGLDDPATLLSTGRVWPRRCSARRRGDGLHVEAEVVGWQWIAQQSSGFAVHDYVYFLAKLEADLVADVRTEGGHVVLRLRSRTPATVQVAALGEVHAHAANPAAALLGIATGIVGLGPSTLATNAMKGRVHDTIVTRAASGFELNLDDPALGDTGADTRPEVPWLKETEGLYPRGALVSGAFPSGIPARLEYEVEGDAVVLARPVCVDEAASTVDTFLSDKDQPVEQPAGVLELRRGGQAPIAALPCPWLLVTAVKEGAGTTVKLRLGPVDRRDTSWGTKRLVRATLLSVSVVKTDPDGSSWDPQGGPPDVLVTVGPPGRLVRFGEALPNVLSATPWLASPLFEMAEGEPLEIRAVDLDPKGRSWLTTRTEYDEQLIGEGRVTAADVLRGEVVSVALAKSGQKTGEARVRFTSVRSGP